MLAALKMDIDAPRKPYETYAHFKIGNGYATLALIMKLDVVTAGIAYCSKKDRFIKSKGRLIAKGRRDIPGHKYAFSFKRNDKPIIDQLRSEFEKYATTLTPTDTKAFFDGRWVGQKNVIDHAPRWAYKAIMNGSAAGRLPQSVIKIVNEVLERKTRD